MEVKKTLTHSTDLARKHQEQQRFRNYEDWAVPSMSNLTSRTPTASSSASSLTPIALNAKTQGKQSKSFKDIVKHFTKSKHGRGDTANQSTNDSAKSKTTRLDNTISIKKKESKNSKMEELQRRNASSPHGDAAPSAQHRNLSNVVHRAESEKSVLRHISTDFARELGSHVQNKADGVKKLGISGVNQTRVKLTKNKSLPSTQATISDETECDRSKSFPSISYTSAPNEDFCNAKRGLTMKYDSDSHKSNSTTSGTSVVKDNENAERLFCTRRDSRKIRALKSLRLLPKSPSSHTVAELGVQVDTPEDHFECETTIEELEKEAESMLSTLKFHEKRMRESDLCLNDSAIKIKDLETSLKKLETVKSNLDERLRSAIKERDNAQERLQEEYKNLEKQEEEIESLKINIEELEQKCQDLESARKELTKELSEVNNHLEKKELEVAFLQEEKDDALNENKVGWDTLEDLNERIIRLQEERDDWQALCLKQKSEYAANVGKLTEKLENTIQEKRYIIKKGAVKLARECPEAETLRTAELYLQREEENHILVEQMEFLATQGIAQDITISQLMEELEDAHVLTKAIHDGDGDPELGVDERLAKIRMIRKHQSEHHQALLELLDVCGNVSGMKNKSRIGVGKGIAFEEKLKDTLMALKPTHKQFSAIEKCVSFSDQNDDAEKNPLKEDKVQPLNDKVRDWFRKGDSMRSFTSEEEESNEDSLDVTPLRLAKACANRAEHWISPNSSEECVRPKGILRNIKSDRSLSH